MKKLLFLFSVMLIGCNSSEKKEKETMTIGTSNQVLSPLEQSIERGSTVYKNFCVQCHLPNGKGIKGLYPPLDASDWLTDKRQESIHAVKYGLNGEIEVNGEKYNNIMLPMGLDDQEIADVMNYVMSSWSNKLTQEVTAEEVKSITK